MLLELMKCVASLQQQTYAHVISGANDLKSYRGEVSSNYFAMLLAK